MRRECAWNTKESWTHIYIRRDRNDTLRISTTTSKVFAVGHSQGTIMSLAALTQRDIAELVETAALFRPISYLEHITSKFALRMVNIYVDQCKFGSTCKFDHPVQTMRYNLSASSLVDMPVVQYPVGSLLATLAPSSSSSDLRPELLSASKKDTYSNRVPASGNTSSSSGGLIFSQSGSVSLSDVQLSSRTSSPLSNSRSARPGGEFRRSI